MQLRYVASELGIGLKRNVTMTLAVILTIWISLTLVGLGMLVRSQVGVIEKYLGSQLEVQVAFCGKVSTSTQCVAGQGTPEQERAVQDVIKKSDDVASYRYRSRQEAYDGFVATHTDADGKVEPIVEQLSEDVMPTAYWVKFKDPDKTAALISQVMNLPGVDTVFDARKKLDPVYSTLNVLQWISLGGAALLVLAAVLQVSNTIRLAALARRREIGIMRLVGASSLYIQLPFVLEVVFSALVGAGFACLSIAGAMKFFIPWLRGHVGVWPWIEWSAGWQAMGGIVVIALVLAVIPTLLMTRKYLKV